MTDDVIAEVARRFDLTIDDANGLTTLDDLVLFQTVASWRETAWRNAELLAQARTPEARDAVACEIEDYAELQARAIRWPRNTCHSRARRARRLLRDPLGELGSAAPSARSRASVRAESSLPADWPAGLAVPAVSQLEDPVAGSGAGDQVEPVGLGDAIEQPGALARNVGEQGQLVPRRSGRAA